MRDNLQKAVTETFSAPVFGQGVANPCSQKAWHKTAISSDSLSTASISPNWRGNASAHSTG